MKEAQNTIPTLWKHVNDFVGYHPENVLPANETILPWILNRQHNYNLCHMWSNFEIVDLSFFRSSAYQKYFEYLDNTGNFFYERYVLIVFF
jgi:alpha 1,2-mannosyltransferase